MFTLVYGEDEKSLADWGLRGGQRTRHSLDVDVVDLIHEGANVDADPLFPYGADILIKKDGVDFFRGKVSKNPRMAKAEAEQQSYQIVNAWRDVMETVFQQTWRVTNGITTDLIDVTQSRIVLNQDLTDARTNTAQQITAALEWAITCGVSLQIGTIGVGAVVPYSEVRDLTCGEIIRRMLQWTPDVIAEFDYSTNPPTFNVLRRAACTAKNVPLYSLENGTSLQIARRDDLLRPGVVIKYTQSNNVDGDEWTDLTEDIYPVDLDQRQVGVLVGTIPLKGFSETFQYQKIVTEPLDDTTIETLAWWQRKFPWLKGDWDTGAGTGRFELKSASITAAAIQLSPEAIAADKELEDFPRAIVLGSCPDWLEGRAFPVFIKAYVSWEILDHTTGNTEKVANRLMSMTVQGTDLSTGTYQHLESFSPGEDVPEGLAQQIYNAISVLQYEGTLQITNPEVVGDIDLHHKLNLTGGRGEWTTMNAQIQQITEDLESGAVDVVIGPAKQLGIEDLVSLMRATRGWRPTNWRAERTQAKTSGSAIVAGAHTGAGENGSHPGGVLDSVFIIPFGGHKITIDLSTVDLTALGVDVTMKPRVLNYNASVASFKQALVLMSESYDSPVSNWLSSEIDTLLDAISAAIDTAEAFAAGSISAAVTAIHDLIDAAEDEITTLTDDLDTLYDDLTTLSDTVTDLASSLDDLITWQTAAIASLADHEARLVVIEGYLSGSSKVTQTIYDDSCNPTTGQIIFFP